MQNDYKAQIDIEFSEMDTVLKLLPQKEKICKLNQLELCGTANLLTSIYNGLENILKRVFYIKNIGIPKGDNWHKQLLNIAYENKIIDKELYDLLYQYLMFRHFIVHAYGFYIYADKIEVVLGNITDLVFNFKIQVEAQIKREGF
ncbi:MAG: hypothetical protein JXA66_06670 [Oligoflexia bacterium]|nr:hypothetical protein [Oligoflexia bacterium]